MRKATEFWGHALQKFHNKSLAKRDAANELRYLGYYTDAGAYYYYNTEEGLDYDQGWALFSGAPCAIYSEAVFLS